MAIDRKLIAHLEGLARIRLGAEERDALAADLERIVRFVESIRSVDTSGAGAVSPLGHLDAEHLRDDEPVAGLDSDSVLRRAPDSQGGFFRVPPVIERGDGG
jgi:aspartyl-tRNA(Asn)/glutamyl-tRNA(Gln) amidotransferase subunit C